MAEEFDGESEKEKRLGVEVRDVGLVGDVIAMEFGSLFGSENERLRRGDVVFRFGDLGGGNGVFSSGV